MQCKRIPLLSTHLRISNGNEDAVKELLDLQVEESRSVSGQFTQNQNLQKEIKNIVGMYIQTKFPMY